MQHLLVLVVRRLVLAMLPTGRVVGFRPVAMAGLTTSVSIPGLPLWGPQNGVGPTLLPAAACIAAAFPCRPAGSSRPVTFCAPSRSVVPGRHRGAAAQAMPRATPWQKLKPKWLRTILLCRTLLPVCSAESYSRDPEPLPICHTYFSSVGPKASPGWLCRDLLTAWCDVAS